jgi:hypothetical protein
MDYIFIQQFRISSKMNLNIYTMYTKILILAVLSLFIVTPSFTQEKSKKQLKEEAKIEKQKQTEAMINSKEFVFIARLALPSGMRSVDLTTRPNYVRFHPEMIESSMPYFGKAYTSVGYGGDQGLKFEGKPEKYTVTRGKKDYQISAEIKGNSDYFRLSLSSGFDGEAVLTIISNNRSTISYNGSISVPEKTIK